MIELDEYTRKMLKALLLALYEESSDEIVTEETQEVQVTSAIRFGHRNAYLTVLDRLGIPVRASEHSRDLFAEALNNVSYDELNEGFGR